MKRCLSAVLVGLGLAVLTLVAPSLAQTGDSPALIRVDLTGPADLARAAGLDLHVLAHLATPDTDYLLAVATADTRERLAQAGLAATVLDPDARGVVYYLVPSDQRHLTEHLRSALVPLHDDGHQIVVRLRGATTAATLEQIDVKLARLGPDPVVLAVPTTGRIPIDPLHDPLVAERIARISTDAVSNYDGGLSGEWPVQIGGALYTLRTRYTYSGLPIAKATQYVYEHMQALGYEVGYHDYTLSGYALRNVVGQKLGTVHPDRIVLLCAHLDSRSSSVPHDPAPGADDNASGSTALMIAADLLADLDFEYTLRLVFFTGEEQGMYGSYYYARDAAAAGEDILGVLNLDMIAWDAKGGPDIDLHSQLPAVEDDSDALADLFSSVVGLYGLDLVPQIVEGGARFSDHSRFWDRGYPAIMAIEDYYNPSEQPYEPRDWNTNYHTANDRLGTLNVGTFREYVRASVATFLHMARPMRVISGTVAGAGSTGLPGATVSVAGQNGNFGGLTDSTGAYAVVVPAGRYTVTASAPGYTPQPVRDVAVLTGAGLRLDFVLTLVPTFAVHGTVTSGASGLPISATLRFDEAEAILARDGLYHTTLVSGTHLVTVSARFHYPVTRTLLVQQDQRQDFALEPTPCLLLVDDDYDNNGNAYDDQVYYTATLEALGLPYDVWPVADDLDGPPESILRLYRGVVWLTGRDWDYTLTAADQAALTGYLAGGGRLLLSGQDIGWDLARNGAPSFYTDILHAEYLSDNSQHYELVGDEFMAGLTVTIAGGDGANNQAYPSEIRALGEARDLFHYTDNGATAAIAVDSAAYRLVYLAFGFEGINSESDRHAVMARVRDYLAICPDYGVTLDGPPIGFGEPGEPVVHHLWVFNTGLLADAYNLSLVSPPAWTTTLGFTRTPLLPRGLHAALAITVQVPLDAVLGDSDGLALVAASIHSPSVASHLMLRTAVGYPVYVPFLLDG
jgi:hypothetical protein